MYTATYESIFTMALIAIEGMSSNQILRLIKHAGSSSAVFELSRKELSEHFKLENEIIDAIELRRVISNAEREVAKYEQASVELIPYGSKSYPQRIAMLSDAPPILFKKGTADLNALHTIGIVGTRSASLDARRLVDLIFKESPNQELSVISGMAVGVDILAHRAAMEYNHPTICVFAHGLDRVYPAAHTAYAHQALDEGGAWISDFPFGTKPDRYNFPSRNRLIAALSDALVVVESKLKGGSIITAELAAAYHKPVFAFPGNVSSPVTAGCHRLIRRGLAKLITGGRDLMYELNWENSGSQQAMSFPISLSEDEETVLHVIRARPQVHLDVLSSLVHVKRSALSMCLFQLEMNGCIRTLPGKRYEAI